MKKQQYVAAVACLVAGAIGFVSVYATEKAQEKRELARQESQMLESQQLSEASKELLPKPKPEAVTPKVTIPKKEVESQQEDVAKEQVSEQETKVAREEPKKEETVQTVKVEALHFEPENGIIWPIEGEVLLDYSMDSTIYFPTLEQFRCNPALVISGAVNDKVYSVAKGKIIEIFDSEETGCTVKQELGDGYVAVYGQLKELNFDVGDTLESGQVVGYVSEPTKYYSAEGTNVYFSLEKDGSPIDPTEYLPLQTIDTLE